MDVFSLTGTMLSTPAYGAVSGDPQIVAPVDERLMLGNQLSGQVTLSSSSPVQIPFGSLTAAHVLVLRSYGGPISATLNIVDGAQSQVVVVDPFCAIISGSAAYSAATVTRTTSNTTTVRFFLGQKAS